MFSPYVTIENIILSVAANVIYDGGKEGLTLDKLPAYVTLKRNMQAFFLSFYEKYPGDLWSSEEFKNALETSTKKTADFLMYGNYMESDVFLLQMAEDLKEQFPQNSKSVYLELTATILDYYTVYLRETQPDKLLDKKIEQIKSMVSEILEELHQQKESTEITFPTIRSKPAMDLSRFTGRRDELKWIDEQIKADQGPVYLTGMGGIGKSMLAQKYAKDHKEYESAYIVYDINLMHTIAQMEFAGEKRVGEETEEDIFDRHLGWLEAYGKGLILIIDNFDSKGYTKSFDKLLSIECTETKTNLDILKLLSYNNRVLITTRAEPEKRSRQIRELSEDELLELAKKTGLKIKWTSDAEESMRHIFKMTGRHTMMVTLVTAAINTSLRRDVSAMEKLISSNEFEKSREKVSARDYRTKQENDTFDKLMRVVFQFEAFDEKQKALLRDLSFIPVMGIALELFTELEEEQFGKNDLEEKLIQFRDLHLISIEDERINVHAMISHYLREELHPEYENCKPFIDAVGLYVDLERAYKNCYVLNEIVYLETEIAVQIQNEIKKGELLSDSGSICRYLGRYEKALKKFEKVLEMQERNLPPDHLDIASTYYNIGCALVTLGRYEEALKKFEKALEMRERSLPPEHPDIATIYNNIGVILGDLGRHEEALKNYEKALEMGERSLPPEHPDIATIYNNIGNALGALSRHEEALEKHEKALEMQERNLPPEHPDIAGSYNNIGNRLGDLGRHEEALEKYEKALEMQEQNLPSEHPNIAMCYNNIGVTLGKLGRHEEALKKLEKALEMYTKCLPKGHPYIKYVYTGLAEEYHEIGDFENEEKYRIMAESTETIDDGKD